MTILSNTQGWLAYDKRSVRMDVQLNNGSLELQGESDEQTTSTS